MNHIIRMSVLLLLFIHNPSVFALEGNREKPQSDWKMGAMDEAQMQKMKELGSPGEHHRALDPLAGRWNHTVKWWMTPDASPAVSTGKTVNSWIMDGRFLKEEATGTAMGQPFEGMGLIGYDNVKGTYTSVWIDNVSTSMMTANSQYDPASKTFTEKGSFACPATGEKDKPYRAITRIIDQDHFTYEMHSTGMSGDKEFKTMEITYEREK